MSFLIIAIAGGLGAGGRYGLSGYVQHRSKGSFPVGTATVNAVGALAIGLLFGLADDHDGVLLDFGVGFLGGFTTFSTWMVESVGLGVFPRLRLRALMNLAIVLVGGVALAAFGYTLTM